MHVHVFIAGGIKLLRYNTVDKEWKDVGKGTLQLTREKAKPSSAARLLIRNAVGKILVNCNMYKAMKFEPAGKNGVKFTVLEVNSEGKSVFVTVTVKVRADTLNSVIAKLSAHVPSA